jgi:hypothetical protein
MASQGRSLPLDCYVILHIRSGPPYRDASSSPQIAADAPFQLSSDIWIEKLDQEIAINIQRACEPANHKIDNHVSSSFPPPQWSCFTPPLTQTGISISVGAFDAHWDTIEAGCRAEDML